MLGGGGGSTNDLNIQSFPDKLEDFLLLLRYTKIEGKPAFSSFLFWRIIESLSLLKQFLQLVQNMKFRSFGPSKGNPFSWIFLTEKSQR